MKNSLKNLFYLGCGIMVLSLAGCGGGNSNSTPSADDVKGFRGGGQMTSQEADYMKKKMQSAQTPVPGQPAPANPRTTPSGQ